MAVVAFQVAGMYAGSFFGPFGAAAGGMIGSVVGNALFGDKPDAPKPNEIRVQVASYGAFKTLAWGKIRVPAILFDASRELTPHEHSSGGKGGPDVPGATTYSIGFLDTFFCMSEGTHSVLRLWFNKRLVGDYRSGATSSGDLPVVFYNGAADQSPDPTEEAFYGAGLIQAYRRRLRAVFTDLALEGTGNAIPQIEAEVASAARPRALSRSASWTVSTPTGFRYDDNRAVGYEDGVITVARWITTSVHPGYVTNGDVATWRSETFDEAGTLLSTVDVLHTFTGSSGNVYLCSNEPTLSFFREGGSQTASRWMKDGAVVAPAAVDGGIANTYYGGLNADFCYFDGNIFAIGGNPVVGSYLLRYPAPGAVPNPLADARVALSTTTYNVVAGNDGYIYVAGNNKLQKYDTDLNLIQTWSSGIGQLFPNGLGYPTEGEWLVCDGTFLSRVVNLDGSIAYVLYEIADALPWTEISRVDSDGVLGVGPVWNVNNGFALTEDGLLSVCVTDAGLVTLAEVVADLHAFAKDDPATYDVTELIDLVRGFAIYAPPTGRSAIDSLKPIFAFGSRDSGGVTTYVKLGKPPSVEFDDADLGAHDENGNALPSLLQRVDGNDREIPQKVFFKFLNADTDYLMDVAVWSRQNTVSTRVVTIDTAVVLTTKEANRIVNMIGRRYVHEADGYTWYSTFKYIDVEAEDVATVRGLDLRVLKKTEMLAAGILKFEGVRSRPGVLVQTGSGGGDNSGFEPQEIPLAQATDLAMLDGPFIGADPQQGFVPVAMQGGVRRGWKGAELFKTLDGTNYTSVLTERSPGTIGVTQTALGNYGGVSFDEENVLRVKIPPGGGDLVSVTRDACFGGANLAVVGAEDDGVRGEIIGYKNVTLISSDATGNVYHVTGMRRGLYGSRPFMAGHAIGDVFAALLSVNATIPLLRPDLGIARSYKPVTGGGSVSAATAYPFRSNGLPFAAFAPAFVRAGFVGEPGSSDILIEWNRRSRVSQGWLNFRSPTGHGPPLGEETEAYRVRIYEDGTKQVVTNTYVADEASRAEQGRDEITSYRYTQAQQAADFGAALFVLPALNVAQKCSIGWGWDSDYGAPIFVPSDIGGYVPPSPPLDDPRFVNSSIAWAEVATVNAALAPDDIWVIAIPIGATPTGSVPVLINAAEFSGDPITGRIWTLSTVPGDFGPQGHPMAWSQGIQTPSVTAQFFVGPGAYASAAWPTFPASSTVYLNIKTAPTSAPSVSMFATIKRIP